MLLHKTNIKELDNSLSKTMSADTGTDSQPDLLHNTENEYLELANNAQNHINHLNSTISDCRLEMRVLDERVEFLTLEIVKIGALFQQYYNENSCLRYQLSKITKESIKKTKEIIQCHEKIIQVEDCLYRHKKHLKDALSLPLTSHKRKKTN